MQSKQIIHSAKLHVIARWFTRSSITQESNKMDKIPTQRNNETVKKTDGVLGKEFKSFYINQLTFRQHTM